MLAVASQLSVFHSLLRRSLRAQGPLAYRLKSAALHRIPAPTRPPSVGMVPAGAHVVEVQALLESASHPNVPSAILVSA